MRMKKHQTVGDPDDEEDEVDEEDEEEDEEDEEDEDDVEDVEDEEDEEGSPVWALVCSKKLDVHVSVRSSLCVHMSGLTCTPSPHSASITSCCSVCLDTSIITRSKCGLF